MFKNKYITKNGDPFPYENPKKGIKRHGAHAVVIVGWGVEEVPNFLPVSMPGEVSLEIPYWVVRNSWGDKWNGNGYCKIAMTDRDLRINNKVKLDAIEETFGPVDFSIASPDPVKSVEFGGGVGGVGGVGLVLLLLIVLLVGAAVLVGIAVVNG